MKTWADFGIEIKGGTGNVKTTCPQCSDQRKKRKDPCLSVNVDEGVWHCWHCGWKGTLKEVVSERRYTAPRAKPASDLPAKVVNWFSGRGISVSTLERNRVGAGIEWMPQFSREVDTIQFPFYRGDELVNVKYRGPDKSFKLVKDAAPVLFGLNDMAETTVIVEGEMDKLALSEAGIQNAVSVPNGAPAPGTKSLEARFEFLRLDAERIGAVGQWVIAVDNDAAGFVLEQELARRLGMGKCRRVTWPPGCKDANDVLMTHGAKTLRECIATAEPFPIEGEARASSLATDVRRFYERGQERGKSTGWAALDEHYTVRPGELTVVTGIPGSGKSNWLDALMVNLAKLHGWQFAVFSPENQPLADHAARVVEKWAEMPFSPGPSQRMDRQTLELGLEWVGNHFTWILPDDDWSLDKVLDTAEGIVLRDGIKGLVIDPWNELESMRPTHMSETEYISNSLRIIRQFGRRHGVHVWVVVHPAKLYRDKDVNYPVPTLYDCAGSSHWRNKADNGIVVWRDLGKEDEPEVQIHIQKIRFRQVGLRGMVPLHYRAKTATYSDQAAAYPHGWE
jgi:twinkle protein